MVLRISRTFLLSVLFTMSFGIKAADYEHVRQHSLSEDARQKIELMTDRQYLAGACGIFTACSFLGAVLPPALTCPAESTACVISVSLVAPLTIVTVAGIFITTFLIFDSYRQSQVISLVKDSYGNVDSEDNSVNISYAQFVEDYPKTQVSLSEFAEMIRTAHEAGFFISQESYASLYDPFVAEHMSLDSKDTPKLLEYLKKTDVGSLAMDAWRNGISNKSIKTVIDKLAHSSLDDLIKEKDTIENICNKFKNDIIECTKAISEAETIRAKKNSFEVINFNPGV